MTQFKITPTITTSLDGYTVTGGKGPGSWRIDPDVGTQHGGTLHYVGQDHYVFRTDEHNEHIREIDLPAVTDFVVAANLAIAYLVGYRAADIDAHHHVL